MSVKYNLDNKNAIVTGSSMGIGAATALKLAESGANVVVVGNNNMSKANDIADQISKYGVKTVALKADVTKPNEVNNIINYVTENWGSLDIMVNNAGVSQNMPVAEMSLESWQHMIDINLTGVFICAQAAGRQMIIQNTPNNNGVIINLGSISAHIVNRPQYQTHYNTTKAAVVMLTKCLAIEWAEYKIRVNSVSPGYIKTELVEQMKDMHATWESMIPMGKMGSPNDVANMVAFLASSESGYVTGSDFIVDGGYLAI